jgi:hypothetical protein
MYEEEKRGVSVRWERRREEEKGVERRRAEV